MSSLNKDPDCIGAMFNRIAPFYDFLNHLLSSGMDLWWRYRSVRSLQILEKALVIDVATGTGDFALSLLRLKPCVKVIGIDIAEVMLKRAMIKGRSYQNYRVVLGDGRYLPVRSEVADALMIAYGIRNMPGAAEDPKELLPIIREFRRVLKKSGEILILEFSIPSTPFFRSMYLFYFQRLLPLLGGLISRDKEAYSYLPTSVKHFISPEDMVKTLEEGGFKVRQLHRFLGGVSYFVRASKV
ncbi:MAG: ubiquinone/menaquinone biosynthesis methyltransferase [Syntrophobacterales bacterium]|nr:ubiquinone/menaquinone biosynthesis methyltransferase [Syntrophobacterales bacterium]